MTDDEVEALSKEMQDLFIKKTGDIEESRKRRERIHEINDALYDETLRRIAERYRKEGIDPYKPCPTCGHVPIRKKT